MAGDPSLCLRIIELVDCQSVGRLSPERAAVLEDLVLHSDEARRIYVGFVNQAALLKSWASHPEVEMDDSVWSGVDFDVVMNAVKEGIEQDHRGFKDPKPDFNQYDTPLALALPPSISENPMPRVLIIPRWVVYGLVPLAAILLLTFILARPGSRTSPHVPPIATEQNLEPVSPRPPRVEEPVPLVEPVARFVGGTGMRWRVDQELVEGPPEFAPGKTIELTTGIAELRFGDGARLYLNAPVVIQPISPNEVRLVEGDLVGFCDPQSRGFITRAGNTVIQDLGTEFGVSISPAGMIEAHVFEGLIRFWQQGLSQADSVDPALPYLDQDPRQTLAAGRGVRVTPSGDVESLLAKPIQFVRRDEVRAHVQAAEAPTAYNLWLAHSYELRRDPGTVAYYTFDNMAESPGRLINLAEATHGELDGVLGEPGAAPSRSKPIWTQGRFREKAGLQFGLDDNLPRGVEVPWSTALNLTESFTLAVWLQTPAGWAVPDGGTLLSYRDSPVRNMTYQFSLFLESDPFPNTLQFGAGTEDDLTNLNKRFIYQETPPIQPQTWTHAAVVYDGTHLAFYLNGKFLSRQPAPAPPQVTRSGTPLLIGTDAPLFGKSQNNYTSQAFTGVIDEVLIMKRALDEQAISSLYSAGLPE